MAYETGTATSAADLYAKLISFLTTNADLVAAGQEWETVWEAPDVAPQNASDIVLRGPGLSGQDQVYVGLRLFQDVPLDSYAIECCAMTGILPAGATYKDHVNPSPKEVRCFLDGGTMTYWFTATGRRFVIVVKISTIFECLYAGLFLPYATPVAYPYPLFIGGSSGPSGYGISAVNWRSLSNNHISFMWGNWNGLTGSQTSEPTAWVLGPDAAWRRAANNGTETPVRFGPEFTLWEDGFSNRGSSYSLRPQDIMARMIDGYGGDRMLWPHQIVQVDPSYQIYGILDGCYRCQGVANAAENVITIDGVEHMVVQDTFRTAFNNYWAVVREDS